MHFPYSRGHDVEMTEESALILYFIRKYEFLRKMYGLGTNVIFFVQVVFLGSTCQSTLD